MDFTNMLNPFNPLSPLSPLNQNEVYSVSSKTVFIANNDSPYIVLGFGVAIMIFAFIAQSK